MHYTCDANKQNHHKWDILIDRDTLWLYVQINPHGELYPPDA